MTSRPGLVAVAGLALALALAGCTSTSDPPGSADGSTSASTAMPSVTTLAPDGVIAASRAAMSRHSSVHVAGSSRSTGEQVVVDLYLVRGKGGTAFVATPGVMQVDIIAIGEDLWVRGSEAFWLKNVDARTAVRIGNKYAHTTRSRTPSLLLAGLADYDAFLDNLLVTSGTLTATPGVDIRGSQTVGVRDGGGGAGKDSTFYVRADADPVPLRVLRQGQMDLEAWDDPIALSPPPAAQVVELD